VLGEVAKELERKVIGEGEGRRALSGKRNGEVQLGEEVDEWGRGRSKTVSRRTSSRPRRRWR
jgi:hypothetical protein